MVEWLSGCAAMLARAVRRGRAVSRYARSRLLSARAVRRVRARACRGRAARLGVTTLVVANAYGRAESLPELASFFANVERLGGGRLRLVFVNGWASRTDRDEERTVLEDLAGGLADLGWTGARAVGEVFGIRSLDPLLAPLLFPDEETVRRFVTVAPLAPLLEPLHLAGVRGLALLPGGVRRPFGITEPLLGPDTWQGKVIRTHASLTGESSIRALGATPVLRAERELSAGPPPGVDGMDLHPTAVAERHYPGWLTRNVPLWPRLLLVAANEASFERLSSDDQAVLIEAARRATADPLRLPSPTQINLPDTIGLVEASQLDLTLLRRALDPVYQELQSSSAAKKTLAYIEAFLNDIGTQAPSAPAGSAAD
jgi:TRAP-type C4-dicarboxylate transport system substrate-binding protein